MTALQMWPRTDLQNDRPGQRSRWIIAGADAALHSVLGEWELRAAGVEDLHPVAETNYVLVGELHVRCAGRTVVARAGDTVRVLGGTAGRYWAPRHARMLAIHDADPFNTPTRVVDKWVLPADDGPPPANW